MDQGAANVNLRTAQPWGGWPACSSTGQDQAAPKSELGAGFKTNLDTGLNPNEYLQRPTECLACVESTIRDFQNFISLSH